MPGNIFRRKNRRVDDGGINGYGSDSEDDVTHHDQTKSIGIRGGSGGGDDGYFTQHSPPNRGKDHVVEHGPASIAATTPQVDRSHFHRTPTGLSEKLRKKRAVQDVNLEGGLDICLNIEQSQMDPSGITTQYRLLVPRLWYDYEEEDEYAVGVNKNMQGTGLKRWVSFRGKGKADNGTGGVDRK